MSRWATYRDPSTGADRMALVVGEKLHALSAGASVLGHLGPGFADRLAQAAELAQTNPVEVVDLASVTLRSPIPQPPSIRDFYAFEQHVKTSRERRGLEMDPDWYDWPVFYFTNPAALTDIGEDIAVAPGSAALDFELEVGAVVGEGGSNLSVADCESRIAGYLVFNDWSARDIWAKNEVKFSMGPAKAKDFATTIGPFLVTPDELADKKSGQGYELEMIAIVNGEQYSRDLWSNVHWSFPQMLAFASRGTRIAAGDVIGSGTCGTGCIWELSLSYGGEAYPWLKPGDEVELRIERLGTLRNRIIPAQELKPLR
jgi:2-keto-4-pentenoate hydratase/2-oxohepta-3-ene-1,7-dioic acid hydratase in catechol pathway